MTWKNWFINVICSASAFFTGFLIFNMEPKNPRLEMGFNFAIAVFAYFFVFRVGGPLLFTLGYRFFDDETKERMDRTPLPRWFVIKEGKR